MSEANERLEESLKIVGNIQEVLSEVVGQILKLNDNITQEQTDLGSTQSRSQDALRAGYQTTCYSGLENLFNLGHMSEEACKDFIPRHHDEVEKTKINAIHELCIYFEEYLKRTKDKFNRRGFFDLNDDLRRYKSLLNKDKLNKPEILEIEHSHVNVDIPNGTISSRITIKTTKHFKQGIDNFNTISIYHYDVKTIAKRSILNYIPYDKYFYTMLTDEAINTVKEALKIGMENIQVVYPAIVDGNYGSHQGRAEDNNLPNKFNEPILIGYIDNQMFILYWSNHDKTKPMTCKI